MTTPANGYEYLPVRDLFLVAFHGLFGERPGAFHAAQALLFAGATALLYPLYSLLFAASSDPRVRERPQTLALISALVFAVHPLLVESTTFIALLNATLAVGFSLLALVGYSLFLQRGGRLL